MKIEKLKKLKNGKYKLLLEDGREIVTYDEIIINNMLFSGKNLDNKLLSEISVNNDYYDIYYKTVKMISNKWQSEKEIIDFLDKNEVNDNLKEEILAKLKKENLINDFRYALSYANDAVSLKKNGPLKIIDDLKKLMIKKSIIDEVMSKIDYELINENLINIIVKRNKLNKTNSLYQLKTKLKVELMRLGYESDAIDKNLDKLLKENDDVYKKEYERLYNKYSKKYSGNELKYKVKQALYQKGFNYYE